MVGDLLLHLKLRVRRRQIGGKWQNRDTKRRVGLLFSFVEHPLHIRVAVIPVCIQKGPIKWTCPYQTGHQLPVKLMLLPNA